MIFNTPWGIFRFVHLPFGLKVLSNVFQERLDAVQAQLEGIVNIADNCLVKGTDDRQHAIALLELCI